MVIRRTPWGNLRPGLLADLGYATPEALAEAINYPDVDRLRAALAGTEPASNELMSALLRHYLIVPPLYFVTGRAA